MPKNALISLPGIAEAHASTVDLLLAGMRGNSGQAAWTTGLRAVVRKDDPPEEE